MAAAVLRLQLGRVDHQLVERTTLRRQVRKDPVEYTELARADEAVVSRLERSCSAGASRRPRPFRITKMMPLTSRDQITHGSVCQRLAGRDKGNSLHSSDLVLVEERAMTM